MWIYKRISANVYHTGYFDPIAVAFVAEEGESGVLVFTTFKQAAQRVSYLNGGSRSVDPTE